MRAFPVSLPSGQRYWTVLDETSDLRQYIAELEQRTAELTEQLSDREDDLNAARAANRELMAELNRR